MEYYVALIMSELSTHGHRHRYEIMEKSKKYVCTPMYYLEFQTYEIKSKTCLRVISTIFFMKLEVELMVGWACILNGELISQEDKARSSPKSRYGSWHNISSSNTF